MFADSMNLEFFLEQARQRGVSEASLRASATYRKDFELSAKHNLLSELKGITQLKHMFDEDADTTTCELNHFTLSRLLGSGSAIGQAFYQLFSGQNDNNQSSQEIASLWNLVQAYLDDVIDEYEDLDEELLLYISEDTIRQYLEAPSPPSPDPFIGRAKSPLVVFTLSLCSLLFTRINTLPGRIQNPELYQALVKTSLDAFTGETQTISNKLGTVICPKTLHKALIARCTGPIIAIAQSIALSGFDYQYPSKIEVIIYDIATLFRYIDDTTDLEDDIASGTWNACMVDYLKFNNPEKYSGQLDLSFFESSQQFELLSKWCTEQILAIYDRLLKQMSIGKNAWQDSAKTILHLSVSHVLSDQI